MLNLLPDDAPRDPVDRLLPLATGLGIFLLYLALPSFRHNFDGVACAIAVELGDIKHLVHGNHLLYGVVGLVFHRAGRLLAPGLNALWSLQILDSLLGAAGAALMHSMLRRRGFSRRMSALLATGMALSYGYWLWSLEAQVYMLGLVLLVLALRESLRDRPSPYRLALWHGLAMLSHGANALFTPMAVSALWRSQGEERPLRGTLGRYLVSSTLLVLAGYLAAAVWAVRPADLSELNLWLLGSAALGPGRSVAWHGTEDMSRNLVVWLKTGALAVSPSLLLSLPLWAAAAASLFTARSSDRRLVVSGVLWLISYALLFVNWEPFTLVYRVSDLPPLWLLAAAAVRPSLKRLRGRVLCLAYVVALGATNLASGILPFSRPESNRDLQEALWLRRATPEDAWVVVSSLDQVYVPYFAHRLSLNLNHLNDPVALRARLRVMLSQGRQVFVTSRTLETLPFPGLFDGLGLAEAAASRDCVLYRITGVRSEQSRLLEVVEGEA